jgi:hypothetical protein
MSININKPAKAEKREAREEERLLKVLVGGITLATVAVVLQLLLSRLFARPAPVAMPAYDYVIDIYADKVVITASDGSTTTLNSVDELNSWLKSVRDKRIRINAHVVVTSDLRLTRNEYWVFGEWINANVFVTEPNTTIISFAPLGNDYEDCYVVNYDLDIDDYVDISGFKLFAVYADADIITPYSIPPPTYMPVSIVVLSSTYIGLMGTRGDVVVKGFYFKADFCKLGNTFIDVVESWMVQCDADNSFVVLISRSFTWLDNVNLNNALDLLCDMRFLMYNVGVPAGGSASINLPLPRRGAYYDLYIEQVGVANYYYAPDGSYNLYYLTPLPSGVSYSIDAPNKRIVITNSTASYMYVTVIFRILILY